MTVPHAIAELLALCGSAVVDEMFTALQSWVPSAIDDGRWIASVKVTFAATANDAFVHPIEPPAPTAGVVQFQPAGIVIDLNVAPDT